MSDEITITSSTDSPDEVMAAVTGKTVEQVQADAKAEAEAKAAETPAETPTPTPTPTPTETPTPAPVADDSVVPPNETPEQKAEREARLTSKEKRLNKIQTQIDDFTGRKHAAKREAEAEELRRETLRRENAELDAQIAAKKAAPTPSPTPTPTETPAAVPAPKLEDQNADGTPKWPTYEAWMDAHAKWNQEQAEARAVAAAKKAVEEVQTADRARIERDSASRDHENALAQLATRIETFKVTRPDYDAVVQSAKDAVQDLVDEIGPNAMNVIEQFTTVDAENGPAVIYHLAQHPDEMERIAKLPIPQQLIALGRLDSRLAAAPHAPARPPVAAPVTQAPEPTKPVGSMPTASGVTDDESVPWREWADRRNAEERARRGRVA